MNDETERLVLVHLPHIRSNISEIDQTRARLDRIEQWLELNDS